MEVILLEKIGKLGNLGDKVRVKPGYGRNYLIPFGKAVRATEGNIAEFEQRRAALEQAAAEKRAAAEDRGARLAELAITISAHAGDEGRLFGSVGARDIAEAVTAAGVEIAKSEISLPTGPIRQVGEYEIDVHLHGDVAATIALAVVAD